MLTVHHLENFRCHRILWLLEELGVPYGIKRHKRDPRTSLAPPELMAIHPLGKAPVIADDGATIVESGAIIEYLVDRFGKSALVPAPGTAEKVRYTYWMHFAEGTAMPPLVMKVVFNRIERGPLTFFAKPIARGISKRVKGAFIDPNLERIVKHIDTELAAAAGSRAPSSPRLTSRSASQWRRPPCAQAPRRCRTSSVFSTHPRAPGLPACDREGRERGDPALRQIRGWGP